LSRSINHVCLECKGNTWITNTKWRSWDNMQCKLQPERSCDLHFSIYNHFRACMSWKWVWPFLYLINCGTGGLYQSTSLCNNSIQPLAVRIAKAYTTQLCFVVYACTHTQLSFASLCMGSIHNSASLRCVSAAYTTQLRFVVYRWENIHLGFASVVYFCLFNSKLLNSTIISIYWYRLNCTFWYYIIDGVL